MLLREFNPIEILFFLYVNISHFPVLFCASLSKFVLFEVVSISSLLIALLGVIVIDIVLLLDL